jgi:uncharacterized membrane protein YhaH (DUF805 family)
MEWFLRVVKNFSFDGRARRKEYWMFTLFAVIIVVVLSLIDVAVGTYFETLEVGLLSGIFWLAILIQSIAVGVRRLHDTGRSGWWLLLILIPLVGPIIVLVLMALEGRQGDNQYGPDPKQPA